MPFTDSFEMMQQYAKIDNGRLILLRTVPHCSNPGAETMATFAAAHGYLPYMPTAHPADGGAYSRRFVIEQGCVRTVWVPQVQAPAERIDELKKRLDDTDYVAAKLAEVDGEQRAALLTQYAEVLAQRQAWREEIGELEPHEPI